MVGMQSSEIGCLIAHFSFLALGIDLVYSVSIRDEQKGTKRSHVFLHCSKAWI